MVALQNMSFWRYLVKKQLRNQESKSERNTNFGQYLQRKINYNFMIQLFTWNILFLWKVDGVSWKYHNRMLNQEKPTRHPSRLSSGSTYSKKLSQIFSDLSPSSTLSWFIPSILGLNHKIKSKAASQVLKNTFMTLFCVCIRPPEQCLILFHWRFFTLSQDWIKFQSHYLPNAQVREICI